MPGVTSPTRCRNPKSEATQSHRACSRCITPNRVHELLHSDDRVVGPPPFNEEIEDVGRPILHLVNVEAAVEH